MGTLYDRVKALIPLRTRLWIGSRLLSQSVLYWLARHGWVSSLLSSKYAFAERHLGGLKGIEIGGSAHNRFPVNALNVDRYWSRDTLYKSMERETAGWDLPVDIVALGDELPFADGSVDFVLASHVIEHMPDPLKALLEWERVARCFVFLVVPHRDRTFDSDRPLTTVDELLERHATGFSSVVDAHWSVWTCESFVELCNRIGLSVVATEDPDEKVGNGFAVVIAPRPRRATASTGLSRP